MEKVCSNALTLALALDAHPKVAKVHYPGLSNHDQHERAAQLFGNRFGGLMGIELIDEVDVFDFLNRLKVLALATHLGDNRTLVLPMAHTIYYEMGPERRALMGIRSEEHTSELQSLMRNSYAVFCLKKQTQHT